MVSGTSTRRVRSPRLLWRVPLVVLALSLPAAVVATGQLRSLSQHSAIKYLESTPTDPVAELRQRMASGEVTLEYDADRDGYLGSVLRALDIPVSSQGLVFSRTSLQLDRISPWSPRAIYFNEDTYIGYVQGGPIIEVATVDPKLGAVFYSLPQAEQAPGTLEFTRETTTCLLCHDSAIVTGGVPGFMVRSMYTDRYGYGITAIGDGVTTDMTPIEERWGGWYVTGTSATPHAGNVMAPVLAHEVGNVKSYMAKVDLGSESDVIDLEGRFDAEPYLSPHSDIVSLLVLAHQSYMHNLITMAGYESRKALYMENLGPAIKLDPGGHHADTRRKVAEVVEPLVRGMLFVKEAPLGGPVVGTSGFAEEFEKLGVRDAKGRSLRDLDMERRMFKYPLSYLIYSEAFEALPQVTREQVYTRLHAILTGRDKSDEFAHLDAADRQAILEILRDTKPDFAAATTVE